MIAPGLVAVPRAPDRDARYDILVAHLGVGVVVQDATGTILEWNSAAEDILGLTGDEIAGRTSRDPRWFAVRPDGSALPGDEHPAMVTLRRGVPSGDVMGVHRPDGTRRWLSVQSALIDDAAAPGERLALTTFLDITENQSVRERLEATERISLVSTWRFDPAMDAVTWSSGMASIFGLAPAMTGLSFGEFLKILDPGDRDHVARTGEDVIAHPRTFVVECRAVRPDGVTRNVVVRGEPELAPDGRLVAFQGTMQDVTDARQREAQLRALLDTSPDSITRMDRDLRHVEVNAAVLRQSGLMRHQIVGRRIGDFAHGGEVAALWEREVRTVFASGEPCTYEYSLPIRDEERWLESRAAPERGPHGEVEHVVIVTRDVTDRRRAVETLAHRASHDGLTGLPNRHVLLERLEDLLHRDHRRLAVFVLDLDRFKLVNDSLGHPAGDALLVAIAIRLREAVRGRDLLVRLGGDEFVVVAEGVETHAEAVEVAERLQRSLGEPISVQGHEVRPTASIGIAVAAAGSHAPELLSRADAAMYLAKERGRDRFEFFDDALRSRVECQLDVDAALRRALEHDELLVHYQPIVDLRDATLLGVEALARWDRPGHGLLDASHFIPVAEETGLIVELGRTMFARATADAALWNVEHPDRSFVVHINLSARQLGHNRLVDDVHEVLFESGARPETLCIEVTETALMTDTPVVRQNLLELRALGLRFAIDDFGSGYSSLAYLKRLPVDALKVDAEFVTLLPDSTEDAAIVEAIVALGRSFGATVIAEGVETDAQRRALLELGCTRAQGFLFAPALAPGDLAEILAAGRVEAAAMLSRRGV
jgi:diguanylate cyclase (GGDEF)-like protein/PAS domain S-box-containing protein